MSKRGGYAFTTDEAKQVYRFTSTGPSGDIQKIVAISPAYGSAWNFAFGDATGEGDDFDDEAVSNNGDIRKVIQTLANIVYGFLEEHPDLQVILHPVDKRRHNLYNWIIQRNFEEVNQVLSIYGVRKGKYELLLYPPQKLFDAFLVSQKHAIFEQK